MPEVRQVEAIRDEERALAPFPGSTRLSERLADNYAGTAPALDVCWQAPATYRDVVAYFQRALPETKWRVIRAAADGQLSAERNQVRLLVHPPDDRAVRGLACPADTTYTLSYTLTLTREPPRP